MLLKGECSECLLNKHCPFNTLCINGFCRFSESKCGKCESGERCIAGICTDCNIFNPFQERHPECQFCQRDIDCYPYRCIDNQCKSKHCVFRSDCPKNMICIDNVCLDECTVDNECSPEEICENQKCVPKCITSRQCQNGQWCDRVCKNSECMNNQDCKAPYEEFVKE